MVFPTEKREVIFGAAILCSALFLANCALFGSLNLGFAIGVCLCILCSAIYLSCRGCKPGLYSGALLVLSMVIATSFGRTDDIPVKFVLTLMLLVCLNLGLCLQAKKNRRDPGTAATLLDGILTMCMLPFCEMGPAFRGIGGAYRSSTGFSKKGGAVLLGLGIALPLLIILVPLLMNADAAFEGFVDMLPSFSLGEFIVTVLFGVAFAILFYTRTMALKHTVTPPATVKIPRGLSSLTVNTVLISVCVVYVAYLASQLAYFSGGFSGILPEEYTLAEYARRGFFEMAWLCALNLCIIVGALWVCVKKDPAPLSTRILCLFIGIVTLFLVATASAKMVLYIDSYGLTRLRVLTQVSMIFLGIVTLLVCLWLFIRKLPYMKAVILAAMVIGAAVSWADVDTLVASYNTNAYLSGRMATVDVAYLDSLGDGAVPYLARLQKEAENETIRSAAYISLICREESSIRDFRSWNYASAAANAWGAPYQESAAAHSGTYPYPSDIVFPESDTEYVHDTHNRGLSSGLFLRVSSYTKTDARALIAQMESSQEWSSLPLPAELSKLLNGEKSSTAYFRSPLETFTVDMPKIRNGYWYFCDRHPESTNPQDPSGIFDRDVYHLTFAIFDADTQTLYHWVLDS